MTAQSTEKINKLLEDNSDVVTKVNDAIVSSEFTTVKQFYMDLACLKDTRMGLMLLKSDDTWKKKLQDGLKAYNLRIDRRFTTHYPDFPYSEEQLEKWYHDPTMSEDIFSYSPDTDLSYSIGTFINNYLAQNSRAGYNGKLTLWINTWPLVDNALIRYFINCLAQYLDPNKVQVRSFFTDPGQLNDAFISAMDAFVFDDFIRVTSNESAFSLALYGSQNLIEKEILASLDIDPIAKQKQMEAGFDFTNRKDVMDRFELTASILNLYCRFRYVFFRIPDPSVSQQTETVGD